MQMHDLCDLIRCQDRFRNAGREDRFVCGKAQQQTASDAERDADAGEDHALKG